MSNAADDFHLFLPMISDMNMSSIDLTFFLNSSIFNRSNEVSATFFYHPVLYGAAIYALFLIIIGTIGNILTIIILLRPNLRKHTTMRYLIAVAMADLCALYSWNLNLFYKHLINPYQNDLEDSSIISCRMISYIAFVSLQLSSWYLTLVSLDRCLNIYLLFWHRKLGHANHAVYIILVVTLVIALLNSHLLFLNGYRKHPCIPFEKRTCFICYARPNDAQYIFPNWERMHIVIYNLIPFSLMLLSNSFIIRRSTSSSNTSGMLSIDLKRRASKNFRQRKQKQLTYLLLFVTFSFVLLTTPVMIYKVFLRNALLHRRPLKYILQAILLCMQFTSHAINFFVYCYGASKFRRELKDFFTSCTLKWTHPRQMNISQI